MTNPRALHQAPSTFSAFIGLIFWAIAGATLAFAVLLFQAPKAITGLEQLPKHPGPGEAKNITEKYMIVDNTVRYFDMGSMGYQWDVLRRQILGALNASIEVSAGDINAWVSREFVDISGQPISHEKIPSVKIAPQTPRFFIHKGVMQMTMPFQMDAFSLSHKFRLTANGSFASDSDGPKWRSHSIYINSAPIPFPKTVYGFIEPMFIKRLSKNEEAEKLGVIWQNIQRIDVTDKTLRFVMKGAPAPAAQS